MQFQASLSIPAIPAIARVVTVLSKPDRTIVLHLLPGKTCISSLASLSGTKLWCQLDHKTVFVEYAFERSESCQSSSDEGPNDGVLLEIDAECFATCLRKSLSAMSVRLKLSSEEAFCRSVENRRLVFVIEAAMDANFDIGPTVNHEIPVKLIPCRFWSSLSEPTMSHSIISFIVPCQRTLRVAVEHMKNLDSCLTVSAEVKGRTVNVEISVRNHFIQSIVRLKSLERIITPNSNDVREPVEEVQVNSKSLATFLSSSQHLNGRMIFNLTHNEQLHLFLVTPFAQLQLFLPAVIS